MNTRRKSISSFIILALFVPSLLTQTDRASLNGTVIDPSGAVIRGVKVSALFFGS
jgi:hypothetical protein